MALSAAVVFTVPKAEAANGPCDEGDWAYAYIAVGNSETKDNIFSSQGSNAIDGVSYDKASNTLTLNQYKNADNYIATNMMGDDFKIRLIGENEISSIVAYGDAWADLLQSAGRFAYGKPEKTGRLRCAPLCRGNGVRAFSGKYL